MPCYFSANGTVFINSQQNWSGMKYQSVSIYKHVIVWKDSITEKWARRRELEWKQQELPRQMLLRLLGCQDWNTHTHTHTHIYTHAHANAVWPAHARIHTSTRMHMHTHTQTKKGLPLQCCLGSWSHQPSLTPLLSVAITAVSLWVNMDGAAPSTTHTGPNNKTSKSSLTRVRLTHAREGLPRVWSYPASGFTLIICLHSRSKYQCSWGGK